MTKNIDHYVGREQTWVKHTVVQQYLQKLAYKIGWRGGTLNYIDGFAGPWQHQADDISDTSPHIAITELLAARARLAQLHRPLLRLQCIFNEMDKAAASLLTTSLSRYPAEDIKTHVLQGAFEDNLPTIHHLVQRDQGAFSFFFIDPTGWTGFSMQSIATILHLKRSEVLINFMTEHIRRFIDDDTQETRASFDKLFGCDDYRTDWEHLHGQDREDAIVRAYCQRIKTVGQFRWVVSAAVLHPTNQRSYFHLIYATRHDEGLRVFRDVERKAMEAQEKIRAKAQQDKRIAQAGQTELFSSDEYGDSAYYSGLRQRYLSQAKQRIEGSLRMHQRLLFDTVELQAMETQMVWSSDVKAWVKEWVDIGSMRIEGLAPRAHVPQTGKGHELVWIAPT